MARLDIGSESLDITEAMADRADAYRAAIALLKLYDWGVNQPEPTDALHLALFIAEGEAE